MRNLNEKPIIEKILKLKSIKTFIYMKYLKFRKKKL